MERRDEQTMMIKRSKWQYPQVGLPAPRILQLPRRQSARRSSAKFGKTTTPSFSTQKDQRVRLEALFHQERSFDRGGGPVLMEEEGRRREKVAEGRETGRSLTSSNEVDEAKWRFQTEMLRSECNLLRIEKEIALKKMERRKKRMEKTLRSAVHTLLSGKQRISQGKKESKVLEDEISYLIEKLNELKSPKINKDMEEARDCRHNFDRQASVLRRELEKFHEEEVCVKGIQKMAEASFLVNNNNGNIDTLSSKMEALSILSKTIDLQDVSAQDMYTKKDCSRHCKAVMRKIADQVRAEAEQWSQMQEMLGQVRNEMEELQSCRDFWQNRALESDSQIQNLHSSVEGWRRKASSSEANLKNMQAEVCGLQEEIKRLKKEGTKLEPEKNKLPTESEKRVLICRLKENRHSNNGDWSKYSEGRTAKPSYSRQPLREIKNGSVAAARQRNTPMS
ncbi:Myosin-like protein [Hirschfeldia incana]|nr:Myosin-like protein [Hirschfeldia incana]